MLRIDTSPSSYGSSGKLAWLRLGLRESDFEVIPRADVEQQAPDMFSNVHSNVSDGEHINIEVTLLAKQKHTHTGKLRTTWCCKDCDSAQTTIESHTLVTDEADDLRLLSTFDFPHVRSVDAFATTSVRPETDTAVQQMQ